MKSWVGIGEGRVGKSACCVGMSVSASHTLWDRSAYRSIRAQCLLKLKASSYARFEYILVRLREGAIF